MSRHLLPTASPAQELDVAFGTAYGFVGLPRTGLGFLEGVLAVLCVLPGLLQLPLQFVHLMAGLIAIGACPVDVLAGGPRPLTPIATRGP